MYENLGLGPAQLRELWKEIDIIVNGAATTNFYERSELFSVNKLFEKAYYCGSICSIIWPCRYDVAFDTNVMGAKHICQFAKRCTKIKMLLHVSTGRRQQ